jgi:RNA polymerase sigma-70 factor (ECF subfamily)
MAALSQRAPDVASWYERYAPRVRVIVARITRNPDDTEDALQEAFLAAWRARERFDTTRDPLPWLTRIAARKAITVAARRSGPYVPAGFAPSAEDEVVARDAERDVHRLVEDEPAFALHVLGGLTVRSVAVRLGVPHATAASRVLRAKRRIRAAVAATTPTPSRSKQAWSTSS